MHHASVTQLSQQPFYLLEPEIHSSGSDTEELSRPAEESTTASLLFWPLYTGSLYALESILAFY